MNDMEGFFDAVTRSFAFLVDQYGFQLLSGPRHNSPESIRYEKKPLVIEVGWYKGEIDIAFYVDLENDVFRPYVSRTFHLSELARRQDKTAYRNGPRFPNYITTRQEAQSAIQFEARVMRKCCKSVLQGDLRLLEEITRERTGKVR
jgi:hypothetical protein